LIGAGRCEEGIVQLRKALDLLHDAFSDLQLAWGYARCGRSPEARQLLSQALRTENQRYLDPIKVAHVFAALGETEQALHWLTRAVADRAPYTSEMAVEPALEPLRSDPRFFGLLQSVGLPAKRSDRSNVPSKSPTDDPSR
jgi:tetratricopeptide (TPR) repeat protein